MLLCSSTQSNLSSVYCCPGYLSFNASDMQRRSHFSVTFIVMTTCLCAAALHVIASKAEETTLLSISSASHSTLPSCSALSSSLSSCQTSIYFPFSREERRKGANSLKYGVMSGWTKVRMKGKQEVALSDRDKPLLS